MFFEKEGVQYLVVGYGDIKQVGRTHEMYVTVRNLQTNQLRPAIINLEDKFGKEPSLSINDIQAQDYVNKQLTGVYETRSELDLAKFIGDTNKVLHQEATKNGVIFNKLNLVIRFVK